MTPLDPYNRTSYSGPSQFDPTAAPPEAAPPEVTPQEVYAQQLQAAQVHGALQAEMCCAFYLTLKDRLDHAEIALYLTAQVWRPQ